MAVGSAWLGAPTAWADSGFSHDKGHTMSPHGRGQMSAGGHVLRYLLVHQQEIGLSEEQITKLRAVALDADRAAIRASADHLVSERELRAMIWDAKAELPAIEAKVKEAESFDAAVRIIKIRAKRDLMAVLTPDQKAKLKTLRHHRHHDRMPAEAEPSRQSELHKSEGAPLAG
jgi:Spy/CpxP family protein refolding chaperone